ncbi:unnamed protein product [Coregonus sp. 'balchen']|nr:unnamed protein product [Coregonus sp. 'balchen']
MAAEVNGSSAPVKEEDEPMDITVTHTENYQTLIDAGLPQKVAESLDNIFQTGLVAYADLDERAIDALREFNEEGALSVLMQFRESDLSHVQNKSAFLCGVMKTYRQREKQGSKVQESTKGPDETKIKALLETTGYTLDVTTGQRKYGGPPPDEVYSGAQPGIGTEARSSTSFLLPVFVGKIPRDLYEDELVPLFEKAGPIWDLRLMMDPLLSGQNRGYAFITFCNKDAALEAVKLGLVEVILYHQPDDKKKNRGFCFLEYEDHKTAAQARRRLMSGKVKVWGNPVTVEWADPVDEPDPEIMAKVKVLFVRNLATPVTEDLLEKTFSQFGKLERVKKLKDYAFVHFEDRDAAVKAMQQMNGKELEGEEIEIVLAKPPDRKRKERQAQRQPTRTSGGRGAPPPRGRGGYVQRGAPMGVPRGSRGGRGGPPQQRGRGSRGARGNRGDNVGGKRKADGYNQPDSKRRQTNNQNWGSQPIAQQPLQQGGDYSGNYGYNNDNQEFYQDSYGHQWKRVSLVYLFTAKLALLSSAEGPQPTSLVLLIKIMHQFDYIS